MDNVELSVIIPPITKEQLISYAEASNDYNPIHTNEKKAIEYGLQGVIAHGMLTMAFMSRMFGKMIERGSFVQEFHARFKEKVFVGDQLTVIAEQDRDYEQETLDHYIIRVINAKNEEVASGYATLNHHSIKIVDIKDDTK